jgi:hypothetical protein
MASSYRTSNGERSALTRSVTPARWGSKAWSRSTGIALIAPADATTGSRLRDVAGLGNGRLGLRSFGKKI